MDNERERVEEMTDEEALAVLREEVYQVWREMRKNGEHEIARKLGAAYDKTDGLLPRLQRAEEALRRGREIAAIPAEGQVTLPAHRVWLLIGEAFFQGVEASEARYAAAQRDETP